MAVPCTHARLVLRLVSFLLRVSFLFLDFFSVSGFLFPLPTSFLPLISFLLTTNRTGINWFERNRKRLGVGGDDEDDDESGGGGGDGGEPGPKVLLRVRCPDNHCNFFLTYNFFLDL